jgi:hypothetical protein
MFHHFPFHAVPTLQGGADLRQADEIKQTWILSAVANGLLSTAALVTGNSGAVAFWEVQGPPAPAKPCASPVMPACRHSHCFSATPPIFVRNPDHCKMAACLRRLTQSMTKSANHVTVFRV